jgi:hypothetical protein
MLAFSIGVVLFAYASVGLGLNGHVPTGLATYGVLFALLMLTAHLAIRKLAAWADPLLLPLAALLNGLGLVMIYRLQEAGRNGNPGNPISTMSASTTTFQLVWSTIGVIAFVAVLVVVREPRMLQRYTYTLGVIGLVLLALPALLPNSISEVPGTGAKIRSPSAGSASSRRSSPNSRWPCSSCRLPGGQAGRARAGRRMAMLGIALPRARTWGQCSSPGAPACWCWSSRRHRHLGAVLRDVP